MNRMWNLGWVDWALIAFAVYLLACFPMALRMDDDSDAWASAVASLQSHKVAP